MHTPRWLGRRSFLVAAIAILFVSPRLLADAAAANGRFLYVATPGVRDYLEYGGHGVLVFDIDHGHRFVRRIPFGGVDAHGKPLNVKGVCASASTGRLYVSTTESITCFDLTSDRVLWEKKYPGGCDRLAISPDGKMLFVPTFEGDRWHVVDAIGGDIVAPIVTGAGAHNTIVGPDGAEAYLAGLKSPNLAVVDTHTLKVLRSVGSFSDSIRPFTINGAQTRVYVNVNKLLGFEIGDLKSGRVLRTVSVQGFPTGEVKRHGCPSHGIALSPDERELWLADSHNQRVHIFDLSGAAPRQIASIAVRDQPGWITFGIGGEYVYPSTGDVIDARTRKIVATLTDETGTGVQSEKLLEVDFRAGHVTAVGDQFAIGQKR